MSDILETIASRDPWEREFYQAVKEVAESVKPVLDRHPHYPESVCSGSDHRAGARGDVSRSLDGRPGQGRAPTAGTSSK
ncbi:MAG: hypothetical protein MZV70_75790 [Desulfobacterales bacterium]|nr:hypothetical protein [Desulfobacterales bacterium]